MLEGQVINDFNDTENNLKLYEKGDKFCAETKRYNDLKNKGYVGEGKEVKKKEEQTKTDK